MKSLRGTIKWANHAAKRPPLLIGRLSDDLQSLNISWNPTGGRPIRTPRLEPQDGQSSRFYGHFVAATGNADGKGKKRFLRPPEVFSDFLRRKISPNFPIKT